MLEGREVRFASPADAKRAGVALVTEDRKRLGLFPQMNVRENITICMLDETASAGVIAGRKERRAARDSIDLLSIKTPGTEVPITGLSGGNQQKSIIARWLRTRPKVLLLDDPTRGVDVGAKAELYRVIDRLCRDGLGILVTSSELPELIALCDRILVLCEGRLTGSFHARPIQRAGADGSGDAAKGGRLKEKWPWFGLFSSFILCSISALRR